MDSSKAFGGSEECSSSESGWTKYIASPTHEDGLNENDDYNDLGADKKGDNTDDDHGSDDSMASDASSGPSHPNLHYGSHLSGHFKHLECEDQSKIFPGKKPYKQAENKTREKRTKSEKEKTGCNPNSSAGYAHNGAKVRKPNKEKK